MDAGLSFIMTNHAKVKENDLVFDPFVGTGIINPLVTLLHRCCLFIVVRNKRVTWQSFLVLYLKHFVTWWM